MACMADSDDSWPRLIIEHPNNNKKECSVYSLVCIKEYKEEAQCAQKGGRMLVFVICGFIKNVLPNCYFILQIYHVKSFKMMHVFSLYFNFSLRYS